MNKQIFSCLVIASSLFLSSCSPIGLAAGAGASLGMAASQEGGIKGAATDIRIKTQISNLWVQYDLKTYSKLGLTVDQGRVLITGVVQNPENRVQAVRLAWQVEGVKQVINEVRVADSEGVPGYVQDKWITTRLRTAMVFDADIQSINYSIDTVQGTVYLMGVAQNQVELDRVIAIARNIPGVTQVISYVKRAGESVIPTTADTAPTPSYNNDASSSYQGSTAPTSLPPQPEPVWQTPLQ